MLLLQSDRSHWSNGHSLASRCGAQQVRVRPSLECRKISSFFVHLHNTQPVPQDNYFTFKLFLSAIYTFNIMLYNLLCAALRIIELCCSSLTSLPSRVKSQILFALSVLLFYFFQTLIISVE